MFTVRVVRVEASRCVSFLSNFDKQKGETVKDQERTRQTIVALLEHISSGIGSTEDMPSQERLEEMKDEVSFKTRQLETSQQTMARLQEQRAKRIEEMEKINKLDCCMLCGFAKRITRPDVSPRSHPLITRSRLDLAHGASPATYQKSGRVASSTCVAC